MKLRKIGRMVGAAIAISVLVATLFGTGIMAQGINQIPGNTLSVTAETVHGHVNTPYSEICVQSSQYKPGQQIVWRVWVADKNGNTLTGSDLSSVTVTLPEGVTLNAEYGNHGPFGSFWAAVWTIPADYRVTGSLPYEVSAKALDGSKGRFDNSASILILSP